MRDESLRPGAITTTRFDPTVRSATSRRPCSRRPRDNLKVLSIDLGTLRGEGHWKKQYGGLQSDQVRELKQLQDENARLKKLVAELSLDKAILQDINAKKWSGPR